MVPIAFVLAFVREEVASSKLKRGIDIAVTVLCVLVVAVWIVRLINPADAGLLLVVTLPPEFPPISSTSNNRDGSAIWGRGTNGTALDK